MSKRPGIDRSSPKATGTIDGFQLASILQLVQIERRSCRLAITSETGGGEIWIKHGEPVHATGHGREGDEAVLLMLEDRRPRVRLFPAGAAPARTVTRSLIQLLLEAARREDSDAAYGPASTNDQIAKG